LLHFAIIKHATACVRVLLQFGADISLKAKISGEYYNSEQLAFQYKHADIALVINKHNTTQTNTSALDSHNSKLIVPLEKLEQDNPNLQTKLKKIDGPKHKKLVQENLTLQNELKKKDGTLQKLQQDNLSLQKEMKNKNGVIQKLQQELTSYHKRTQLAEDKLKKFQLIVDLKRAKHSWDYINTTIPSTNQIKLKLSQQIYQGNSSVFVVNQHGNELIVKRLQVQASLEQYIRREIYLHWYLSNCAKKGYFVNMIGWYRMAIGKMDWLHIVMEKAYSNLKSYINEYSAISKEEQKHLIVSIIDGICALHELEIAHRDLKPENVLIFKETPKVIVKLCDFGASRYISIVSQTYAFGTDFYMAPEIVKAKNPNNQITASLDLLKADIWALGKVIYFIWMKLEYKRETEPHWYATVVTDPVIIKILDGCLKDSPAERLNINQLRELASEISWNK